MVYSVGPPHSITVYGELSRGKRMDERVKVARVYSASSLLADIDKTMMYTIKLCNEHETENTTGN